jgi:Tfp pilus assembly protein PilN
VRAVNLLPRQDVVERKPRESRNPAKVVAALGGTVVVIGLVAGMLLASQAVGDRRAELEAAQAELAGTPRPPEDAAAGTQLASVREQRVVALASAIAQRVSWDRVLRRFALVLPEDVWLTSLSGTVPTGPAAAAVTAPGANPTGFTITGYTYSHGGVARLLSRLSVVPDLTNVQLQTSTLAELGGREIVQFTILADVRRGGQTS